MVRKGLYGRVISVYPKTKEDLIRWKKSCGTMTLSGWICELIEKHLENEASGSDFSEEMFTLQKENISLKSENDRLKMELAKKNVIEDELIADHSKNLDLYEQILELLRLKGSLSSTEVTSFVMKSEDLTDKSEEEVTASASNRFAGISWMLSLMQLDGTIELTRDERWRLRKK